MINKLIQELRKNALEIYGVTKISPSMIFHHGIKNYPKHKSLIDKYSGKSDNILKELLSFIQTEETFKDLTSGFHKRKFSLNGSEWIIESMNSTQDPIETFLNQIFNIGIQLELQQSLSEFQKNPGLNKSPIQPNDVSFATFLMALFHLENSDNIYFKNLSAIFRKNGFIVDDFIEDYNNSEADKPSLMEELCENLNELVLKGKIQPAIGRDNEISQIINILKKAKKNNPILVGKAGVGKTAIAEGLAWLIVNKQVPKSLENAVIYNLQVMDMVKGTSYRGQFEEKMSKLLKDFKKMEEQGNILPILFIDEIHTIMGSGNNNGLDFANIIKPALARGELRTIGATTTDEWHKFIKENSALDRRLVSVTVKEPSIDDTLEILSKSINIYEKIHSVKYKDDAIKKAVYLTDEFIHDNAFPDKAFDLLDFVGAMNHLNGKDIVELHDVESALSKQKNISLEAIQSKNSFSRKTLAQSLKKNLFGQDEIIEKVSRSVEKSLAGLGHSDKPMGSFLFLGPTGTGKTQLAKNIANEINAHFHRIDMSEFMESHSVSKLIGSPPGYIGHDNGSSLTKVIIENPRTVLLLDEIEKAHPQVLNIFLQAMDNAKITDSKGKEISFRNVLLIMTSNAGAKDLNSPAVGIQRGVNKSKAISSINKFFSPEFRARLTGNGPLFFNPMNKKLLKKIALTELDNIETNRLADKNISLDIQKSFIDFIISRAESINLGARPVKDLLETHLVEPLSDIILYDKDYKKALNKKESLFITVKFKDKVLIEKGNREPSL